MKGAKGVIVSITGGEDMRLLEVDEAANHIRELVDEDANIIWGSAFNPELEGKIRVSVVATGIEADASGVAAGRAGDARLLVRPPQRSGRAGHGARSAGRADARARSRCGGWSRRWTPSRTTSRSNCRTPVTRSRRAAAKACDAPSRRRRRTGARQRRRGRARAADAADVRRRGIRRRRDDRRRDRTRKPQPAPKVKLGGTLFERMQNVARGAFGESEPEAEKDSLDIPRFLHRQNNQ